MVCSVAPCRSGLKIKLSREIQDGQLLAAQDCSSQWKPRERDDATLLDEFSSLKDQEIPSGGALWVTSVTLAAGAAVLPVPRCSGSWCRVNGTGSPFGRHLELIEEGIQEGSQTGDSQTEKHQESWCHCFSQHSGLLTFWPWELTSWTSTKRPNLKVGNYKEDRWINLQQWEETSVKRLRILKIKMPLPLKRITVPHQQGNKGLRRASASQ